MGWLWALPFLLQGIVIGIDEFFFHQKRGLPKWERIGHPFDTLSLIISMLFLFLVKESELSMKVYIGLALFSSLAVTKDEFVHAEVCPKAEHLLHAFLFLLHPTVLIAAGLIWDSIHSNPIVRSLFTLYIGATFFFFLYQVIFWNWIWKEQKAK